MANMKNIRNMKKIKRLLVLFCTAFSYSLLSEGPKHASTRDSDRDISGTNYQALSAAKISVNLAPDRTEFQEGQNGLAVQVFRKGKDGFVLIDGMDSLSKPCIGGEEVSTKIFFENTVEKALKRISN